MYFEICMTNQLPHSAFTDTVSDTVTNTITDALTQTPYIPSYQLSSSFFETIDDRCLLKPFLGIPIELSFPIYTAWVIMNLDLE